MQSKENLTSGGGWQDGLGFKACLIGALLLIMLIPLMMIGSLVEERASRATEVINAIGEVWGHEQEIVGPFLILPYDDVVSKTDEGEKLVRRTLVLLSKTLKVNGNFDVERRSLGLFDTNVYTAHLKINALFDLSKEIAGLDPARLQLDAIVASLVLGDLRGLQGNISVTANGQKLEVEPGSGTTQISPGVHVVLPNNLDKTDSLDIEISFSLRGSEAFNIWPSGGTTEINLKSAWQSPSFLGRFSPSQRSVTADGFTAKWEILRMAQGIGPVLREGNSFSKFQNASVRFVEPVNSYSMSERSIKYGSLFVLLTFAVLYLFEILAKKKVHPVQYMLMGLALCLFFLALLALSEHVPFGVAYGLASLIVVTLVSAYAKSVTRSSGWTIGIGVIQSTLFAFLYGVLMLEDMALLAGATLLLAGLASAMYLTRNVDWYQAGKG